MVRQEGARYLTSDIGKHEGWPLSVALLILPHSARCARGEAVETSDLRDGAVATRAGCRSRVGVLDLKVKGGIIIV